MGEKRVIVPTVGRVLLYYPKGLKQKQAGTQPCASQVAFVENERLVNLGYLDPEGRHQNAVGVPLRQPDDDAPEEGGFAEWMEYQIGAAKA